MRDRSTPMPQHAERALDKAKGLVTDQAPLVEVGRLELWPAC
jgi:hypothetical protein